MRDRPLALVIEDNADLRELYASVLQMEGFAVEQACNGEEGFQKAIEV